MADPKLIERSESLRSEGYARDVFDAVAQIRGYRTFRDLLAAGGGPSTQRMLVQHEALYVDGFRKNRAPREVAQAIQDRYWSEAFTMQD